MGTTILRVAKVKSIANVRQAGAHQYRHHAETPNADPTKKSRNIKVIGSENLAKDVQARLDDLTKAPRKNAVLAMDGLVTLSPELLKTNENLNTWANRTRDWLKERFGENLVNAVIHLDESNPHMHFTVVPLDEKPDGRKVLNARDMFDKWQLADMQKSYNETMRAHIPSVEPPKYGSKAKHTRVKEFYSKLDELSAGVEAELKLFAEELKADMTKTLFEKLSPLIERQFEDLEKHVGSVIDPELKAKLKYEQERKLEGCLQFAINESKTLQEQEKKVLDAINNEVSRVKDPQAKPRMNKPL